jgi:FAD/FMN-containing dehydrogenase
MLPRVGVFHAPHAAINLRDLLMAAREVCTVVIVMRQSVAETHPDFTDVARAFFEVSVYPDDHTSAAVHELGLDGVTTFHDDELVFADAAARRWELPGAPTAVDPWDKLRQRRAFTGAGISPRRAIAVGSPADLHSAIETLGLPGALKPRRGTSSVGVSLLLTPADVRTQVAGRAGWRSLLYEELLPSGTHPSGVPWLANYVSVETVSGAACRQHVAVFDKVPVSVAAGPDSLLSHTIRETGDVLPTRLPDAVLAGVLDSTSRALDALGVHQRVTHTELLVSASGTDVIEVNGRLGGEVARMVQMLDGPDMARAALTLALGADAPLSATWRDGAVACLYVPFPQRGGVVRSNASRADLRTIPGVIAVDEVAAHGAERSATGYRAAKMTLAAANGGALDAAVAAALDRVSELYAADGLDRDPWLCGIRERIRSAGSSRASRARAGLALEARGFSGPVLGPDDEGYQAARQVWNGRFNRRPALIARCHHAQDVSAALRWAADAGLPVTVRGGGHNVAGTAVADGALMVDLSLIDRVEVDVEARLARAGGGALLRHVDQATLPVGLVCPSGVVSHTGLGGLILGGGYGWLCRKWGLTCDHLEAAEVVLADGTIVDATDATQPELMWGLRGGGGNFGVVTRFTLRLRPVGDVVLHSMVFDADFAADVLRVYRSLGASTPEDLLIFGALRAASADWLPSWTLGRPVLSLDAIWLGDPTADLPDVLPLLTAAPTLGHRQRIMSFAEVQASADGAEPPGRRYFTRSCYVNGLSDEAVPHLVDAARRRPSPLSTIDLSHLLGAIARVPEQDTAFSRRKAPFLCSASAAWTHPTDDAVNIAWSRGVIEGLAPSAHGGTYVNYMELGSADQVAGVYGDAHYRRLVRLKEAVDPRNVFRSNQNIVPDRRAPAAAEGPRR